MRILVSTSKSICLLISLSLVRMTNAYAQYPLESIRSSPILPFKDTARLTIGTEAIGFFKDNEYFSPIAKGKTLPGMIIRPTIGYQPKTNIRIEFGMHGLLYSGDTKSNIQGSPFSRIEYQPLKNASVIFGNYYGGNNHRLLEPIYRWENHLERKPESGLQFLFEDKQFFVDTWINWEHFIRRGDSLPEILTYGFSGAAAIGPPLFPEMRINIPLQLTIHHEGGQIEISQKKVIVVGNLATGVSSNLSINERHVKDIGLDLYVIGYYDKLPDKNLRPFRKGIGLYVLVKCKTSNIDLQTGIWYAKKFYSFDGESLFASFNTDYPQQLFPTRKLITNKCIFRGQTNKSLPIRIQIETYTDITRNFATDYSLGIFIYTNFRFFNK